MPLGNCCWAARVWRCVLCNLCTDRVVVIEYAAVVLVVLGYAVWFSVSQTGLDLRLAGAMLRQQLSSVCRSAYFVNVSVLVTAHILYINVLVLIDALYVRCRCQTVAR
jgi:hypothetical protein